MVFKQQIAVAFFTVFIRSVFQNLPFRQASVIENHASNLFINPSYAVVGCVLYFLSKTRSIMRPPANPDTEINGIFRSRMERAKAWFDRNCSTSTIFGQRQINRNKERCQGASRSLKEGVRGEYRHRHRAKCVANNHVPMLRCNTCFKMKRIHSLSLPSNNHHGETNIVEPINYNFEIQSPSNISIISSNEDAENSRLDQPKKPSFATTLPSTNETAIKELINDKLNILPESCTSGIPRMPQDVKIQTDSLSDHIAFQSEGVEKPCLEQPNKPSVITALPSSNETLIGDLKNDQLHMPPQLYTSDVPRMPTDLKIQTNPVSDHIRFHNEDIEKPYIKKPTSNAPLTEKVRNDKLDILHQSCTVNPRMVKDVKTQTDSFSDHITLESENADKSCLEQPNKPKLATTLPSSNELLIGEDVEKPRFDQPKKPRLATTLPSSNALLIGELKNNKLDMLSQTNSGIPSVPMDMKNQTDSFFDHIALHSEDVENPRLDQPKKPRLAITLPSSNAPLIGEIKNVKLDISSQSYTTGIPIMLKDVTNRTDSVSDHIALHVEKPCLDTSSLEQPNRPVFATTLPLSNERLIEDLRTVSTGKHCIESVEDHHVPVEFNKACVKEQNIKNLSLPLNDPPPQIENKNKRKKKKNKYRRTIAMGRKLTRSGNVF